MLTVPVPENVLAGFIAYLFDKGYATSTIVSTVSAISFVHKLLNMNDTADSFVVKKMLQGCKKLRISVDCRLPMTTSILGDLIKVSTNTIGSTFTSTCFKAMCSLAFFALLRIGEMTDSENNLSIKNVQCHEKELHIQFTNFKHSDGFPSRHTIKAQPASSICPVRNVKNYMKLRGSRPGPLFLSTSGQAVQQQQFNSQLKVALEFAGYSSERYKSHSFRIGGASFMASQGASDNQIRLAGRWKSNAFLAYIRIHQY